MGAYASVFVAMELTCITIVLLLAYKMNKNIGTFGEIRHFWNIQLVFVPEAVTEILWTLQRVEVIHFTIWQLWLVNGAALAALSLLLYEWFRFIMHELRRIKDRPVIGIALRMQKILLAADILLIATSVYTGFVFRVDAEGIYSRGYGYWLHSIFCYSNWLWTSVLLAVYLGRIEMRERKWLQALFYISFLPALGGVLQIWNYSIPFLDISVALGSLLVLLQMQEARITADALTRLNNRADFTEMYERMQSTADTHPFTIFVSDIDKFKTINDVYGHLAGDRALVVTANGLRKVGAKYRSIYICRYGGDEFVILGMNENIHDPEEFVTVIKETLQAEPWDELGFEVSCSVGYAVVDSPDIDVKTAFAKADAKLYEVKRGKYA